MAQTSITENIRANRQSLLIVAAAVVVFAAFSAGEDTISDSVGVSWRPDTTITIGLYKKGRDSRDAGEYFKRLQAALERAGDFLEFKEFGTCERLCQAMKNGTVDIGGELTPLEYVRNYGSYMFKPFLGTEYEGEAYYYSYLFVADSADRCGWQFLSKFGHDNTAGIRNALRSRSPKLIAYLGDETSTSSNLYARSYLILHGYEDYEVKWQPQVKESDIYKKVLSRDEDNNYVAGFLAGFRLQMYTGDTLRDLKHITDDSLLHARHDALHLDSGDTAHGSLHDSLIPCIHHERHLIIHEEHQEGINKYPDSDYFQPLIVDKSDPIPNGVFVVSKTGANRLGEIGMDHLVRLWKTVDSVKVHGNFKITGWRGGRGLEHDLDLVEEHYNRVKYFEMYTTHANLYMAIATALATLVASATSYLYIRWAG